MKVFEMNSYFSHKLSFSTDFCALGFRWTRKSLEVTFLFLVPVEVEAKPKIQE